MEYVVFETGGKQYKAEKGQVIEVDNLSGLRQEHLLIDRVLLYVKDSDIKIGRPYLDNVRVKAKILENLKGDKIKVARFAAKSRHRRKVGFRPYISKIQIEDIATIK